MTARDVTWRAVVYKIRLQIIVTKKTMATRDVTWRKFKGQHD